MSKKNSKVGLIKLTKTMLDKCIIDANKTVVDFALQLGIDYAKMECGEKILVDAVIDISFFLKDIHCYSSNKCPHNHSKNIINYID